MLTDFAATPSEREPDHPLLREVRMANQVNVASPPGHEEVSFQASFQGIASKSLKAYNDTLGELQGLGVSHDVPLPELVLVGDQSAGKSSVMSGLANLDLPRSDGTCTRCPLHIRVSRNTEWSCRVSLSKEYEFNPPVDRPITESDVTAQDPFFPWKKLPTTQVFEFKTVQDRKDIVDVLRWAQVAILNDDKQHDMFIPGSGAIAMEGNIEQAQAHTSAKFSPNVVYLEIKGPGLPNLSFYDMPGMFNNPADARDDYLVSVVRNLSRSYINRPSAIIMCSIPMNSDAENSYTFGVIRRAGATDRTIGVLTKADLLPQSGTYDQWLSIMNGTGHETGLGYFITSRPENRELETLKQWEEAMFDDHQVDSWPQEFHKFGDRCGVEKLKEFLSRKLGAAFFNSLPQIEHKVKAHHDRILKKLATLPELPDNMELEIHTSLLNFTEAARSTIDDFTRHFNVLPTKFQTCLLHIKPKFILVDKSDTPVFEISDDDDAASPMAMATPSKRRMPPPQTPSKRFRTMTPSASSANGSQHIKPEDSDGGDASPAPRPTPLPHDMLLPEPFSQFSRIGKGFRTLAQVREEIDRKTKAGMPQRNPDEVYEDLIKEAIAPWSGGSTAKGPTEVFMEETMRQLQRELMVALQKSFESLKKRCVFKESARLLKAFIKAHGDDTSKLVKELYEDETRRLLTFNSATFEMYKADELQLLTRFRHKMRMERQGAAPSPLEDWANMTQAKRDQDTNRRQHDLQKIGKDQFERELDVIAYVRGYYKLAALRFNDAVCQRVLCRMMPNIKKQISFYLHQELGVLQGADKAVYTRLMEEDSHVAATRVELKREKDKFEKALASINALKSGSGDGADAASVMETDYVAGDPVEDGI